MINNIAQLRKIILIFSQVLGAIVCLYFIINFKNYELCAGSWTSWMPGTSAVNSLLSLGGTLFLTIPLTTIILSWLAPKSTALRIASGFFGVGSSLILITPGFLNNTVTQVYNMRLVMVTKILSLEEKRLIFKEEILNIMET